MLGGIASTSLVTKGDFCVRGRLGCSAGAFPFRSVDLVELFVILVRFIFLVFRVSYGVDVEEFSFRLIIQRFLL